MNKEEQLKDILSDLTYVIDEVSALHKHVYEYDDIYDSYVEDICDNVENAQKKIREAFEQYSKSKKYLAWKDIEFGDKAYDIKVKLGDNIYILGIGLGYINHIAVLHAVDDKTYFKDIHFTEQDKRFFNDLHLEAVE